MISSDVKLAYSSLEQKLIMIIIYLDLNQQV